MNEINSAVLALLGAGGVTGFGALVLRAFLQALRATATIQARLEAEIERQDTEIHRLQTDLQAIRVELGARDITIAGLQAQLARATGANP